MAGQPDANNTQVIARLRALLAAVLRQNRRPTFGDTSHIVREVDASSPAPKTQLALMFDQPEPTSKSVEDTPPSPRHTEPTPVHGADTPVAVPTRSPEPSVGVAYPVVIDWWTIGFWVSVVLLVVMRFYRIDSIQSEMYGDIEIVQTYVKNVIDGNWPWYFNLSSGPLYHYLIAPVLIWLGTGYDQI